VSQPNYTTSEVARLCLVSVKTVQRWLDTGLLECWTLPGSRHRRVTRDALVRFAEKYGVATKGLFP
jgi:excisionase family DNA binding protein